jgi:hypothetical protein
MNNQIPPGVSATLRDGGGGGGGGGGTSTVASPAALTRVISPVAAARIDLLATASTASMLRVTNGAGGGGDGGESRESRLVTQAAVMWDRWETAETQNRVLAEELAVERRLNAQYKEAGAAEDAVSTPQMITPLIKD